MSTLKSWLALFVREYREHRIAFLYFPAGIMALLALSAVSALFSNRLRLVVAAMPADVLKLLELGSLLLVVLWLAYLAVTLFFYFGDSFSADRRNNAMFFWKSMPVSDLRILAGKFLAGITMFPLIVYGMMVVSGLVLFALIAIAQMVMPDLISANPAQLLSSVVQIEFYAFIRIALSLLWYAPFLAWVGALSAVFGRWSLPLAFVIPGLAAVVENVAFFGTGPRGGYIWSWLGQRLHFGNDLDFSSMFLDPRPFQTGTYLASLWHQIDWLNMIGGLVVAALLILAASEYRRRRIA